LGLPPREPEGVDVTILRTEPVLLACDTRHRLAGHDRVRIESLGGEAFVDFEHGWGIRLLTDYWFAESGVERRVAFTVNDVGALLELVGGGLGVAIVPASVAVRRASGVHYVPFMKGAPEWKVAVVVPADRPLGAAAKKLLAMVVDATARSSRASPGSPAAATG
jgi:DNA-binding transcriptional LysR family regulator